MVRFTASKLLIRVLCHLNQPLHTNTTHGEVSFAGFDNFEEKVSELHHGTFFHETLDGTV